MTLPTYFLSHGGGPWPWLRDQFGAAYDVLDASLRDIPRQVGGKPKAVLVVSSHWETEPFQLSSGTQPGMIYDYGGFPPHTYRIVYGAPGSPALAARAQALLQAAGIDAGLDAGRGFDHGTFSAMYPVFPEADVPIVQLSLRRNLDPQAHLAAGRALRPLRDEGVLIVGSGLSYHNLRAFNGAGAAASHQFDGWLRAAMALPPEERSIALTHWEQAPAARAAHPREEHLLPLMVALGAAEHEAAEVVYHEDTFFGALAVSSFRFGAGNR
ncbi:aromatic ring-opening dioxygenase catalytic subunit (LigB family) [Pseudoduganella lurida]|uniref:Aromatic ring-opening dioxygenase catalytic subunit (LigB family) n=1 Tax=Pseudoduganella lurida TaxID=1036180 RepID=A0A562R853_9BURK|nr:class III extradiol ring-cleavage dioxygenase [Pseudoduganella lurida]TWI65241.1 aromatic ring-opening dioxygenase catalytic subunit (LigB family) [Pseudoduganella lurida]